MPSSLVFNRTAHSNATHNIALHKDSVLTNFVETRGFSGQIYETLHFPVRADGCKNNSELNVSLRMTISH